jgi:hypothetical protein
MTDTEREALLDVIRDVEQRGVETGTWEQGKILDAVDAIVAAERAAAVEEAADAADSIGHHWSGAPALAFFALAGDLRSRAADLRTQKEGAA